MSAPAIVRAGARHDSIEAGFDPAVRKLERAGIIGDQPF